MHLKNGERVDVHKKADEDESYVCDGGKSSPKITEAVPASHSCTSVQRAQFEVTMFLVNDSHRKCSRLHSIFFDRILYFAIEV